MDGGVDAVHRFGEWAAEVPEIWMESCRWALLVRASR
jgi:hypothetical protein